MIGFCAATKYLEPQIKRKKIVANLQGSLAPFFPPSSLPFRHCGRHLLFFSFFLTLLVGLVILGRRRRRRFLLSFSASAAASFPSSGCLVLRFPLPLPPSPTRSTHYSETCPSLCSSVIRSPSGALARLRRALAASSSSSTGTRWAL